MATNNPSDKSFAIDSDVAEIIGVLRENKMQWIADEIESRIRRGTSERAKSVAKNRRKPKEYEDVRGMTPTEQTATLVRALRNYIVLAPRIWNEATTGLVKAMASNAIAQSLDIQIVPFGDTVGEISVIDSKSQAAIDKSWQVIASFLSELALVGQRQVWGVELV